MKGDTYYRANLGYNYFVTVSLVPSPATDSEVNSMSIEPTFGSYPPPNPSPPSIEDLDRRVKHQEKEIEELRKHFEGLKKRVDSLEEAEAEDASGA
jgi:hypothetical protein